MNQKSIKKNMFMSTLLTISNFIFPLLTYSYVARVLTPSGTGKVAFVSSVLSYFSYVATLGIPIYGLREGAKIRDDKEKFSHLIQELLIINLVATVVAYIFLVITVISVPKFREYNFLFVVMSINLFLSTIGVEWVYKALEEYTYITTRSLIFKIISVLLIFLLIKEENDVVVYGFLSIFTLSASYVCNFFNIHKHVSFKRIFPYQIKRHIKPILMLFSASIIITIYANFDISMIGFISSDYEVGLYSAALKFKDILLALSTSITGVIIPRIAYYIQNEKKENISKLILKSLQLSMILAVPFAVYVFLFSENVIQFVCGKQFTEAQSTLKVLMLCIIPLILTNLFGNQLLIPLGKEKRYSQSVFVGMWINLVLNFLLIPFWGSFGAALGTFATECWNVYWMSQGVKDYRRILFKQINLKIYLVSMLTSGIVSFIVFQFVHRFIIFIQLMVTALTFFITLYGLLIILKEPLITAEVKKLKKKFMHKK